MSDTYVAVISGVLAWSAVFFLNAVTVCFVSAAVTVWSAVRLCRLSACGLLCVSANVGPLWLPHSVVRCVLPQVNILFVDLQTLFFATTAGDKVSVYWYVCTRQEPAAGYHCCEGCEARRRLRDIGGR